MVERLKDSNSSAEDNSLLCMVNLAMKKSETYLPIKAVAQKMGFTNQTIKNWVDAGTFPKPVTIQDKPRWLESELEEWVDEQNPARLAKLAEQKALAQEAREFIKTL